jgi:hypothetical protein
VLKTLLPYHSYIIEEDEGRKDRREKGEIHLIPLGKKLVIEETSIKNFYFNQHFLRPGYTLNVQFQENRVPKTTRN